MAWPSAFLGIAHVLRRPVLWLSRHIGGFAELEHVGRRSGRAYATPVRAVRRGGQVVAGASFGVTSDWVRNVLAADGCRIGIGGELLDLTGPRIVAFDEARALLPPVTRFILRRLARAEQCLLLDVA
ncbi:nitroreductase family deazaflavin-dependent oxidoreductase [Nocardioides caeni]|uniref:nitroreductase family deazaflavin-dependent oxidoreductase n=1 Tax=Nocardioides caeni TaxID=574700 RepID=UPI0013051F9D|nr:nitroreductase family deazaflavin-dependent oxidoreductase [Nocardioides caeni]